jgi:hypothetical protein
MSTSGRWRAFTTVFAVIYPIVYYLSVWKNYALFTYIPALGRFGMGVLKSSNGPAMYWYGWIATSALAAAAGGAAAALLPERLSARLWPGWVWIIPLCVMLLFVYLLRNYFLQGR